MILLPIVVPYLWCGIKCNPKFPNGRMKEGFNQVPPEWKLFGLVSARKEVLLFLDYIRSLCRIDHFGYVQKWGFTHVHPKICGSPLRSRPGYHEVSWGGRAMDHHVGQPVRAGLICNVLIFLLQSLFSPPTLFAGGTQGYVLIFRVQAHYQMIV